MSENVETNTRRRRMRAMLRVLKRLYPNPVMTLCYRNNWELLVAVMLSAQCADKRVNQVTEKLFQKYRSISDYASADIHKFERDIRSTGYFRAKTRHIIAAAQMIKTKFRGRIPRTMNGLLEIPGVARKTANVVLGSAYGIVKGIAVDTHVRRFALKFDLTDHRDPKKIERDLIKIVPKREWLLLTHRFIEYGRALCPARRHICHTHPLTNIFPPAADRWPRAS